MSEENVPKLRLKPKLAADPSSAQSQPAAETPQPTPTPAPTEPAPTGEAPKLVRLKPKLSAAPAQETAPTTVDAPIASTPSVEGEPVGVKPRLSTPPMETTGTVPDMETASGEESLPESAAKPVFKLGLKPKATGPQPEAAAEASPQTAGVAEPASAAAPVLAAPPPAAKTPATGESAPARSATTAPFPAPGKFPPPPGLKKALDEASQEAAKGGKAAAGSKKKSFMLVGGLIALLLVAGGGFMAYQKLTEEPPPAPRPKLVAKPVAPQGQAVASAQKVIEQAKAQAAEPINEILKEEPKGAVDATVVAKDPVIAVQAKPVEPAKPSGPLPPPAPTTAFRGWVENLKISGMRGGANPKIFVGGNTYQPGDLINPQLGIVFEEYVEETRTLVFKDKTGAKLEKRN